MRCSHCGVYRGNPVCGCCRASGRIAAILRSGHLLERQEQVVLEALRQVAGLLSDLAEEGQLDRETRARLNKEWKEGNTGRPSGPSRPPAEVKGEEAKSDYTYESSEEEPGKSEDPAEEKGAGSKRPPEPKGPPPGHKKDSGSKSGDKHPSKAAAVKRVDPQYLSKALKLKPAAKSEARGHSDRSPRRGYNRQHHREKRPREDSRGGGLEEAERAAGVTRQPDHREPLRRRQTENKKGRRRRGSGGKKKRERGQNFKLWLEEKKKEKEEREQ